MLISRVAHSVPRTLSVIVFSVAVGMWENQCHHPTSMVGGSTGPNPALLGDMLSHVKGKKLCRF